MREVVSTITTQATQFDCVAFERKFVPIRHKREHVFECIAGYLLYPAALFADHVVVMSAEWFGEFGKRRPATDGSRGDAEFGEKLECAVDACPIYIGSSFGNLTIFEWLIGYFERLKHSLTRSSDTLPGSAED